MSSKSVGSEKIVREVRVRGMWDGSDFRRGRSATQMVKVVFIQVRLKMHGGGGQIILSDVVMGAIRQFYSKCRMSSHRK